MLAILSIEWFSSHIMEHSNENSAEALRTEVGKKVLLFKKLFYTYTTSVLMMMGLLYLIDELDYMTAGVCIRVGITVLLFAALLFFRGRLLYWVFKINIFLLVLPYLFGNSSDIIDYLYFIVHAPDLFELVYLIVSFSLTYVVPIGALIWTIVLLEKKDLASYLQKQEIVRSTSDHSFFSLRTNKETLEWMGMAKADWLAYLSFGAAVLGHFIEHISLVLLIYTLGLVVGVYAIQIGSKADGNFSRFTNMMKKYSYHVSLLVVLAVMAIRFF